MYHNNVGLKLMTYLIVCHCEFLVILHEFENLIMMYLSDSWRVIEEIDLLLGWDHLFLLVIFRTHCEVHRHL